MAKVTFNQTTNLALLQTSFGGSSSGAGNSTEINTYDTVTSRGAYYLGNFVFGTLPGELSGTISHAMIDDADFGLFANLDITGLNFQMSVAFYQSTLRPGNFYQVVANLLSGNDTLIGSAGADGMIGFAGDDTLLGGAGGDAMDGGAGNNTASYANAAAGVVASLGSPASNTGDAAGDSYASIQNLTGSALADTLVGNAGFNVLDGGAGNDLLNGGSATDILRGGLGNDTYFLGDGNDFVSDAGGASDAIASTVSRSLASFAAIERLVLAGTSAIAGTGNNLANVITGNAAANTLTGGVGNDALNGSGGNDSLIGGIGVDTLRGSASNDVFVLNAPLSPANRDVITDFTNVAGNNDSFRLQNGVMPGVGGVGALNPDLFFAGAAAHDANDRIVYNKANGALIYDANGIAAGGVTLLATLTTRPALAAGDFVVI